MTVVYGENNFGKDKGSHEGCMGLRHRTETTESHAKTSLFLNTSREFVERENQQPQGQRGHSLPLYIHATYKLKTHTNFKSIGQAICDIFTPHKGILFSIFFTQGSLKRKELMKFASTIYNTFQPFGCEN